VNAQRHLHLHPPVLQDITRWLDGPLASNAQSDTFVLLQVPCLFSSLLTSIQLKQAPPPVVVQLVQPELQEELVLLALQGTLVWEETALDVSHALQDTSVLQDQQLRANVQETHTLSISQRIVEAVTWQDISVCSEKEILLSPVLMELICQLLEPLAHMQSYFVCLALLAQAVSQMIKQLLVEPLSIPTKVILIVMSVQLEQNVMIAMDILFVLLVNTQDMESQPAHLVKQDTFALISSKIVKNVLQEHFKMEQGK
jgi:hypothetical protein